MTKLFKKYFNIIFFTILTVISVILYKDFGISLDENITRRNGLVNLKYIFDFFSFSNLSSKEIFYGIEQLSDYFDKNYGAFFEILNVYFIEILLGKKSFSDIFYTRHLINHFLFLISLLYFYKLLKKLNFNFYLSTLGVVLLYSTPRIFSHSFYNSKDLAFLSIFIILVYYSIKCLKKLNLKNTILFSIFFALSFNLRPISIYLPLLLTFFIFLESLIYGFSFKKNFKYIFLIFFLSILIVILIQPFLWTNTFNNFFEIIGTFANFERWDNQVFYTGKFYKSFYLPNHYLFVMFLSTTPPLISLVGLMGFLIIFLRLINRLLKIEENKKLNEIWRGENEKIMLFVFFLLVLPLFFFLILNSVLYNGWRHFYFLYPLFIVQLLFSLRFFELKLRKSKFKKLIFALMMGMLLNNIIALIMMHPYQNSYFNIFFKNDANKYFEIDYWGLANKNALEQLVKINKKKDVLNIGVASFTNLHLSKNMLIEDQRKRINIVGQEYQKADYIFTNFYYEVDINYDDKYQIPKNFSKIFSTKRGNIVINEIYERIN